MREYQITVTPGHFWSPHANVWAGIIADPIPPENPIRPGSITLADTIPLAHAAQAIQCPCMYIGMMM